MKGGWDKKGSRGRGSALGPALTMFLKCALSVPVAWWYSITQQLFRISPLLSLQWESTSSGGGAGYHHSPPGGREPARLPRPICRGEGGSALPKNREPACGAGVQLQEQRMGNGSVLCSATCWQGQALSASWARWGLL